MKVRELMHSPVHTCRATDSLVAAARQLWEHDCGMLPVLDAEGRVGAAITDRDICMAAYTRGKPLSDLRVADSMSTGIVTCGVDDDLTTAAALMAQRQVRRLPVVDGKGSLCGMLSLNDLALAAEHDRNVAKESLRVLAAASRPRTTVPAVVPEQRATAPGSRARVASGGA